MNFKQLIKQIAPPIALDIVRRIRQKRAAYRRVTSQDQHLDMYWDEDFAKVLETWGDGNVWTEIQLLMAGRSGKVLDIACGTGKTMEILSKFTNIELYGCDISNLLIEKAVERGLLRSCLTVCDATQLPYHDNEFSYAYSIGSIEHFTEDGIERFLRECHRTVSGVSFHQHPVSRNGQNEGWITTSQSYHNNSVEWWLNIYQRVYSNVSVLDSVWEDELSLGKWFVCTK